MLGFQARKVIEEPFHFGYGFGHGLFVDHYSPFAFFFAFALRTLADAAAAVFTLPL